MIAGLEVYDRLGRLIMGAEDYNRYILGTIDLRGVYFGADHYQKKIGSLYNEIAHLKN